MLAGGKPTSRKRPTRPRLQRALERGWRRAIRMLVMWGLGGFFAALSTEAPPDTGRFFATCFFLFGSRNPQLAARTRGR